MRAQSWWRRAPPSRWTRPPSSATFHGAIKDSGHTASDGILLQTTLRPGAVQSMSYADGVLDVTFAAPGYDRTFHAHLNFAGGYVASGFHATPTGQETLITYTGPSSS